VRRWGWVWITFWCEGGRLQSGSDWAPRPTVEVEVRSSDQAEVVDDKEEFNRPDSVVLSSRVEWTTCPRTCISETTVTATRLLYVSLGLR
jgi:hypothetical protein